MLCSKLDTEKWNPRMHAYWYMFELLKLENKLNVSWILFLTNIVWFLFPDSIKLICTFIFTFNFFFYIILDWIYVEYVRRFQISRIKMINTIIALSCSFCLPLSWDNKRYIPVHVSMHVNLISQIQEQVHAVLFQYLQILFCLL